MTSSILFPNQWSFLVPFCGIGTISSPNWQGLIYLEKKSGIYIYIATWVIIYILYIYHLSPILRVVIYIYHLENICGNYIYIYIYSATWVIIWYLSHLLREPRKKAILPQNADLQWGHIWNVLELSCKVIDATEDGLSQTRDAQGSAVSKRTYIAWINPPWKNGWL